MDEIRRTYRIVNGQKVRIPDDIRDPKRRYGTSSDETGQYDIEFTDEQEKERDLEEAQWEAERPQRELEAKARQEAHEHFANSLIYEERLVVYLDILGWKKTIEDSVSNPELVKQMGLGLERISFQKELAKFSPNDMKVAQFSDSIIFSLKIEESIPLDALLNELAFTLNYIIRNLLHMGSLLRGAITTGQLLHTDSMIYGPALVRAIEIESNKGYPRHPRIVLDPNLAGLDRLVVGCPIIEGQTVRFKKTWRKDEDGWVFYDFLQPSSLSEKPGKEFEASLTSIRTLILKNLKIHASQPSILSKYIWMANYFNSVLAEYPDTGIELIQIITSG